MRVLLVSFIAVFLLNGCARLADQFSWLPVPCAVMSQDPQSPEGNTEVGDEEVLNHIEGNIATNAGGAVFPVQAGSWGGKVRAGPGMEFA